ncbi:dipeptide/oligopeptide/nickel ABC transporter permease/ATP-binding protein [Streptomyces sp. Caat 7-52]|uniref:dipeptide/oligopeptide/nickel ABC transporter permease/ATP-binding protein n=1 Tax=Streptomyces sp. Caat 7-52 TaxID=2949637 RepID=UPI0020363B92|nr:dipeptide/oligopeptide/nickel ABC transporter permease/ATP-binding protein [Streptomyces sp. Caat 7-52]
MTAATDRTDAVGAPVPDTAPQPRDRHLLVRRPAATLAAVWLTLVTAGSVAATWVAPYGPLTQDLSASYSGPTGRHPLGTDQLGRDILSRILYGGRTSLLAVAEVVCVFVALGVLFGLVSGYRGGLVDRFVMRCCDIVMAIPLVVTLLVVLAIFSRNETAAMLTFGVLASAGLARVVRACTRVVRADDYVRAALIAGLTPAQVVRRHILPRVIGPVLIQASLLAASALLVESGLNYLGLGVQPPDPSWGGLVTDASVAIYQQPWLLVPSGLTIVLTALAFGIIGDSARDAASDRSRMAAGSWRQMITRVRSSAPKPSPEDDRGASVLRVEGLTVRAAGAELVEGFDLGIEPGEIVGLVGESGCGKSTVILSLLRLLPPGVEMSAGAYTLTGSDALRLTERGMAQLRGRSIGYIPQEPVAGLDPAFTVGSQLVELSRHHTRGGRRQAVAHIRELLALVQLPEADRVMKAYPHELSGGMAQRVAIARALIGDPQLLVADEPTTALDVSVQAEILDLILSLRDKRGMAILMVTHDWGVVADVCDRAVVMYAGQTVEEGPVREFFRRPRHPYSRALLNASPTASGFREKLPAIPGTVPAPGNRPPGCHFAARCPRRQDECTRRPITLTRTSTERAHRCLRPEPITEALDVTAR